jgi:hypothetical protein
MLATLSTEHLVATIDLVEDDFSAILEIACAAISAMSADDPLREDLVEIRRAAELAILRTGTFVEKTQRPSFVAMLQAG